jgi:hypothetical protein
MSKGKKKEKNPQIEVRTFNWGPCVIKLKIQDDFKKALLSEIKKSSESYNHKLAGQIEKEIGYTQESRDKLIPYLGTLSWYIRSDVSKVSR